MSSKRNNKSLAIAYPNEAETSARYRKYRAYVDSAHAAHMQDAGSYANNLADEEALRVALLSDKTSISVRYATVTAVNIYYNGHHIGTGVSIHNFSANPDMYTYNRERGVYLAMFRAVKDVYANSNQIHAEFGGGGALNSNWQNLSSLLQKERHTARILAEIQTVIDAEYE